jgi:hypothetical protein
VYTRLLPVFFGAILLAVFFSLTPCARAAQIPPFFINSVVALGGERPISVPGLPDHTEWQTAGTGFFYGYLVQNDPDQSKRRYEIYLVTAKHVIQGYIAATHGDIKVRINPKDSSTAIQEFSIPNIPKPDESSWFYDPDSTIDIAITSINFDFLKGLGYEPNFFPNDSAVLEKKTLIESEVAAGDGVFVLGFPMNLTGAQRNYVIVRQGVIARIAEMLEGASKSFMVDSFVFPGNSGGPVVLRPEIFGIQGTKTHNNAALIGVVTDYRPYTDVAVSPQTNHARVLFEENSGLADVLPINYVEETIRAWRKSRGLPDPDTTSSLPNTDAKH